MKFHTAFTVITGDESPDKNFAQAAAKQHNIEHHVIIRLTPKELIDVYLPICVKILNCYDGMTLRNSLVIAAVFKAVSERGCTHAVVGDGADELFGGYSFMWGSADNPSKWKEKRDSMCQKWTFATPALGEFYGVTPHSPYMEPRTVEWALSETHREDCIGERPIRLVYDGEYKNHTTGKVILREAYKTVSSWRRKDPIEVGSGITIIQHDEYWKDIISDEEYQKELLSNQSRGFNIKSKEYLINFRVFDNIFEIDKHGDVLPNGKKRLGLGEGCINCCFEIGDNMFCHVCGAFPAPRHMQPEKKEDL